MTGIVNWPTLEPPGLAQAVEAAGYRRWGVGGVQYADDPEAVEAIIAAFDPIPPLKAKLVATAKAEAQIRILAVIPAWKQNNLLAQATLLNDKGRANWTAADQAAWDAGSAIWAKVAAIRSTSDLIESDIAALTSWQELASFNVAGNIRWPK